MNIVELEEKYGPIKINCEGSDTLPIDRIIDFQGSLKTLAGKNLEKLVKSLYIHGFIAPFFVWDDQGDWKIIDGHQRLNAILKIREYGGTIPGLFPIVVIKAKTEKEAKGYLLAISSQYGEFKKSVLDEWISDLDADIAESLRVVDTEIELAISSLNDPEETEGDDDVPEDVPAFTKPGDIWQLGPHRLMCGDSTKVEDVQRLMNGDRADSLVTDPPYNVAYEGKTKEALTIQNDSMEDSKFREFLKDAFAAADSVMKPGAVFYIWHADSEGFNFRGACRDVNWKVRQCLIWNKNVMVMGRQDYHWKHEPCLYGWKEGAGHLWATDRKQTTILNFDRPTSSQEHPTMKPVPLFEYCIMNNTKEEDIVLDLFGGSGTTMIASEKLGRYSRLMEFDPHYCDVIVSRFKLWCEQNGKSHTITLNGEFWENEEISK